MKKLSDNLKHQTFLNDYFTQQIKKLAHMEIPRALIIFPDYITLCISELGFFWYFRH